MKTKIIRVPNKDYEEMQKIANTLKINIGSAYQIWKKKNKIGLDIEWKEY